MNGFQNASSRRTVFYFLSPWLTGLLLLFVIPMIAAALISCTDWDGLSWSTMKWVGLRNFRALSDDRVFATALTNSVAYTAMNVPAQLLVGLGLALLVERSRRRASWWATLYYLPHIFGGVAMILIWWWLLNPQIGPINRGLHAVYRVLDVPLSAVGITAARRWPVPPWLYSPTWSKPSLVFMNLWEAGGTMLIFLAALLRGCRPLKEAAMLDGAGPRRIFWHVTLPHISPAILFNIVTGILFSMQAFGQAYLLQNWQQQDSLLFYALHIYRSAFEMHRFGYAAALAWVLLAILLVFTATFVLLTRRWVHYDFEEASV